MTPRSLGKAMLVPLTVDNVSRGTPEENMDDDMTRASEVIDDQKYFPPFRNTEIFGQDLLDPNTYPQYHDKMLTKVQKHTVRGQDDS